MRVPDCTELRALYDQSVAEIGKSRPDINLGTGFYAETGNSVFEAGYVSICDHVNGVRRLNVVSAPSGGGKTSFSFAFIIALIRYAEAHSDSSVGSVFVVDQIKKARDCYSELKNHLPGKVAYWTSEDHEFDVDDLRDFPVIVVTHQFFSGSRGDKAKFWGADVFAPQHRALTIIDERPEEVQIFETTMQQAHAVKEVIAKKVPEITDKIDRLTLLMELYSVNSSRNRIVRRDSGEKADELLGWFAGDEAEGIAAEYGTTMPGLYRLFGFARSLTLGCAFVASEGKISSFIGWQAKLKIEPGMMLLDATADIDGVSQICLGREHVKTPQVNFRNLDIIHVPSIAKRNLAEFFEKPANREQYADWMVATIKAYMRSGERGLVVCKKALIDNAHIPNWDRRDERLADPASYGERYEWEIEGRKLCAIHWGIGIGVNSWRAADVVLLFDEFYLPRRIAVATAQGLRGHRADEGDLALMRTLSSKAPAVELIREGHRLRWTKQLALRGRARQISDDGVCGIQRLVVACDLDSFTANVGKLFPGASFVLTDGIKPAVDKVKRTQQLINVLRRPDLPSKVGATEVGKLMGVEWRKISGDVLTPEAATSLAALGWRYVSGKGRGGSHFERVATTALAA